ncbi:MAG: tetratricopeptide repeat protein, partial [Candidatus Omnitrophota bacterium]
MDIKKFFYFLFFIICLILTTSCICFAEKRESRNAKELLHKKAIVYAREGNYTYALELMQEVLSKTPDNPEVVSDYLIMLSWAGQYQEAVKMYQEFSKAYIVLDYAIKEIAKCYRLLNEYNQAITLYKKYLEKNEWDKDALRGLIYTYLDAHQFDIARQYLENQIVTNKQDRDWLNLCLSDVYLAERKLDKADEIYRGILKRKPASLEAKLGMARLFIRKNKYKEANSYIERILKRDPVNIEGLFCKGELLEAQKEFISAYRLYERILRLYPDSQRARNFKYRTLMSLGLSSLVREKLDYSKDYLDQEFLEMLLGDEAMQRIWWQEPDTAINILNNKLSTNSYSKRFFLRATSDKIIALRQKEDMPTLLKGYKILQDTKTQLAPWVLEASADAQLYLQNPKAARTLYEELLERQDNLNKDNTKMALYYDLVELGQYEVAEEVLENLDKDMPSQIVERGILIDNWKKEEIAYNHEGWWFLYQDRLKEAQSHLEELLERSPFNTHVRIALAYTYLWRGWPRLALEEFQIASNIDPKDIMSKIGYSYALNENGQGKEARILAKALLRKYPKNKHIQRLNRYFKVQDMRTLILNSLSTDEHPGSSEILWSIMIEQPLAPWRKIFTGFVWRKTRDEDAKDKIRREVVGLDWRLTQDLWFIGSISQDNHGKNFGYASQIKLDAGDYFSFSLFYDSYSLALPLRARGEGLTSKEGSFSARYRQSES